MVDRSPLVLIGGQLQELPSGDAVAGHATDAELATKITKPATNVSGSGIPWQSEAIINAGALASGYNDLEGGLLFDRQVILRQLSFRLAPYNATIGGSGNLTIDWYQSSMTALPGTLITTTTIAAGQHDVVTTLATPYTVPVNTVVRPLITLGSTTVAVKCHVQLRGDVDVN
ncbi:hypothetical protein [Rhodococcus koreensis]